MVDKNPCVNCSDSSIDEWGFLCDLSCGKHTAWVNYQIGVKGIVEWIRSHHLIKPNKDSLTRFEPFYQIEESELKKWGIDE